MHNNEVTQTFYINPWAPIIFFFFIFMNFLTLMFAFLVDIGGEYST